MLRRLRNFFLGYLAAYAFVVLGDSLMRLDDYLNHPGLADASTGRKIALLVAGSILTVPFTMLFWIIVLTGSFFGIYWSHDRDGHTLGRSVGRFTCNLIAGFIGVAAVSIAYSAYRMSNWMPYFEDSSFAVFLWTAAEAAFATALPQMLLIALGVTVVIYIFFGGGGATSTAPEPSPQSSA